MKFEARNPKFETHGRIVNTTYVQLRGTHAGICSWGAEFVRKLPRTVGVVEDGKQLVWSSGSVGANYIEANESLSKKDFVLRVKICRKEAKESRYWLELLGPCAAAAWEAERQALAQEATELMNIFRAITRKSR